MYQVVSIYTTLRLSLYIEIVSYANYSVDATKLLLLCLYPVSDC